jgi:hypothetical protein
MKRAVIRSVLAGLANLGLAAAPATGRQVSPNQAPAAPAPAR